MEKRKHIRKARSSTQNLKLSFSDSSGAPVHLVAKLVDTSDGGVGIELGAPLTAGSSVTVTGEIGDGRQNVQMARARVSWCTAARNGGFRAGLALENPTFPNAGPGIEQSAADHYDVLQLSSKADPDTIHRVYRMLAQRYHPDNPETGNADMFRTLSEAYRTLSDPEQRAAYDLRHNRARETRWKIFDQPQAAHGMEAERRKRQGILEVLYTKRMHEPSQPAMSIHEIEELLACPREHLEFSLWFLRENGLVLRGDNARYSITAKGAQSAEQCDGPWLRADRMLPAVGST